MKTDDLLKKFCSDDDVLSYNLTKPHLDNDVVVATNKNVLIICPVKYLTKDLYSNIEKFPKYDAVVPYHSKYNHNNILDVSEFESIKQKLIKKDYYDDCELCAGFGFNSKGDKCPRCKGSCNGKLQYHGYDLTENLIQIGIGYYDPMLVNLIIDASKVFKKEITVRRTDERSAGVFFLDDIQIIMMPVVYNQQKKYILKWK